MWGRPQTCTAQQARRHTATQQWINDQSPTQCRTNQQIVPLSWEPTQLKTANQTLPKSYHSPPQLNKIQHILIYNSHLISAYLNTPEHSSNISVQVDGWPKQLNTELRHCWCLIFASWALHLNLSLQVKYVTNIFWQNGRGGGGTPPLTSAEFPVQNIPNEERVI